MFSASCRKRSSLSRSASSTCSRARDVFLKRPVALFELERLLLELANQRLAVLAQQPSCVTGRLMGAAPEYPSERGLHLADTVEERVGLGGLAG